MLLSLDPMAAPSNALGLIDSNAFGTGHHPTTAMCIEALEEILSVECMASILDVGAGTGILALAALKMGVAQAVAIDIDDEALKVAAENAQRNNVADRLLLAHGGPDVIMRRLAACRRERARGPIDRAGPADRAASGKSRPSDSLRHSMFR